MQALPYPRDNSGAGDAVELQTSILTVSFDKLRYLLSHGEFACSITEVDQVLVSLFKRQEIWESSYQTANASTPSSCFGCNTEILSPISEMFVQYQQVDRLRHEVITRGEQIPPSLGPCIFTQEPRLHAQILSVAIDLLFEQLAGISVKGAVPALFSYLQAERPPVHRFGITVFSVLPPTEYGIRLKEGQQAIRTIMTKEPYLTFIKTLQSGSINFDGDTISIDTIRFLGDSESDFESPSGREIKGANPAIVIEGSLPQGVPISLIIKNEGAEMANHFAMSKIVAAFDHRSYRVRSLLDQNGEELKEWLIIEKLPSDFLGLTCAGNYQPDRGIAQLAKASAFTNWLVAREFGAIFALQYACAAQDCWARHILLEKNTNKPYRIDWEQVFHFDDPFNFSTGAPYCMQGDEAKLLGSFISETAHLFGNEEYMQRIVLNGFIHELDRIKWDLSSNQGKIASVLESFYTSRRAKDIVNKMKKRLAQDWSGVINELFENHPPLLYDLTDE